jgi:hypothetical protein
MASKLLASTLSIGIFSRTQISLLLHLWMLIEADIYEMAQKLHVLIKKIEPREPEAVDLSSASDPVPG